MLLSKDVMSIIFSYLDIRDAADLKIVCREFYEGYHLMVNQRYQMNYFNVFPKPYEKIFGSQCYMISEILDNYDKFLIMCNSPVGSGKTAVALYLAYTSSVPTTILINPKTANTWLDEVSKLGLYNKTNLNKTKVYFAHSTINNTHLKHINNIKSNDKHIIIGTYTTLKKYDVFNKRLLIIDEAHIIHNLSVQNKVAKIIAFSASKINEMELMTGTTSIKVQKTFQKINRDEIAHIIGDPAMFTKLLTNKYIYNKTGKYATLNVKVSRSDFTEETIEKFCNDYNKIVVFCFDKQKNLRNLVKNFNIDNNHKLYIFNNTAKTHVRLFKETEKVVVFCTYGTSTEGLSFNEAELLLLFDFEDVSFTKAVQTVGRVKRLNNTNNEIDIKVCVDPNKKFEYICAKLNKIYVSLPKEYNIEKKPVSSIERIINTLEKNGKDITKLTDHDMIHFFTTGDFSVHKMHTRFTFKEFVYYTHMM